MTADHGYPWVGVSMTPAGPKLSGTPSVRLGHVLPPSRPGGAPDGVFAQWHWDGRRLTVQTDRYGLFPLFMAVSGSSLMLSPSPLELIRQGVSGEWDDDAVSIFLRLGFYIRDATPFRAIRAVPPGAGVTWENGETSVGGGHFVRPAASLGWEEAVEGYIETMRASIARRLPDDDNFGMPLTGGRDSRHILLELVRQKRPPRECATVGVRTGFPTNDTLVARMVADAVKVPHRVVIGGRAATDPIRTFALTHASSDEHQQLVPEREYLSPFTKSFDGIGGDILSEAGEWAWSEERWSLCREGKWEQAAHKIVSGHPQASEELAASLARRWSLKLLPLPEVLARIGAEMRLHEGAANPIASFYFWNRTRREIALCPYGMLSNVRTVYAPYLDHDVYDFLASIPVDLLLGARKRFHTEVITRAYPEFAHIGFQTPTPEWSRLRARVVRARELLAVTARLAALSPKRCRMSVEYLATARRKGRRAAAALTFGGYMTMLELARDPRGAGRLLEFAGAGPIAYDTSAFTHTQAEEALRSVRDAEDPVPTARTNS